MIKSYFFLDLNFFGILRSDCAQQQGRIISVADPDESDPDSAFVKNGSEFCPRKNQIKIVEEINFIIISPTNTF